MDDAVPSCSAGESISSSFATLVVSLISFTPLVCFFLTTLALSLAIAIDFNALRFRAKRLVRVVVVALLFSLGLGSTSSCGTSSEKNSLTDVGLIVPSPSFNDADEAVPFLFFSSKVESLFKVPAKLTPGTVKHE